MSTYAAKKTVSLGEVDNVYRDSLDKVGGVFHSEVEPLQILGAVRIVSDEDVVNIHAPSANLVDVCTLEICIKYHAVSEIDSYSLSVEN